MSCPIVLEGLRISYNGIPVVHGIDLAVAAGEIVSLLGPSGCGKTTMLRAIGGFLRPDGGRVLLHGQEMTATPPNRRDIGFVFQGYALFPHMTVFDNVAYGLRSRKVPRADIARRVRQTLAVVQLDGFADRRPRQLSGGQQQRVAIARALVIEPAVLLLDEPLSNLDAKLRQEMRLELRRLLKRANVASLFVTHDQEEAITMSDRIVLMNAGRIEQQGTPREMYRAPGSLFTAAFLGHANFLDGEVQAVDADGTIILRVGDAMLRGMARDILQPGSPAIMVVKHDRVRLATPGGGGNQADCRFETATFLGSDIQLQCLLGKQALAGFVPAQLHDDAPLQPDQPVRLEWAVSDSLVFAPISPA